MIFLLLLLQLVWLLELQLELSDRAADPALCRVKLVEER